MREIRFTDVEVELIKKLILEIEGEEDLSDLTDLIEKIDGIDDFSSLSLTTNCPVCRAVMFGYQMNHYHCKSCNESFTN